MEFIFHGNYATVRPKSTLFEVGKCVNPEKLPENNVHNDQGDFYS